MMKYLRKFFFLVVGWTSRAEGCARPPATTPILTTLSGARRFHFSLVFTVQSRSFDSSITWWSETQRSASFREREREREREGAREIEREGGERGDDSLCVAVSSIQTTVRAGARGPVALPLTVVPPSFPLLSYPSFSAFLPLRAFFPHAKYPFSLSISIDLGER